jgi:hypothetical protein
MTTYARLTSCCKQNILTLTTLAGVLSGLAVGICLKQREGNARSHLNCHLCNFIHFFSKMDPSGSSVHFFRRTTVPENAKSSDYSPYCSKHNCGSWISEAWTNGKGETCVRATNSHYFFVCSKKVGALTFAYYVTTTILAAILGIILVVTIRPGELSSNAEASTEVTSIRKLSPFVVFHKVI